MTGPQRDRQPTDQEIALWRLVMQDATPLSAPLSAGRHQHGRTTALTPIDSPLQAALPSRINRNQVQPQAKLDLHGMTQAQAHHALTAFVETGWRLGRRELLVITGKGTPGVLKTNVPRWLNEAPLRSMVREVRPAALPHGGDGACYVLLRRRRTI